MTRLHSIRRELVTLVVATGCALLPLAGHGQVLPVPIGNVQGPVGTRGDATRHSSPFVNQQAVVQGYVTQWIMRKEASGQARFGVLLQNTVVQSDQIPATSDAIYLDLGATPNLPVDLSNQRYTPVIGDGLIVTGLIRERYGLTQLENVVVLLAEKGTVPIDTRIPPIPVNPPAVEAAAHVYWERLEGMRVRLRRGAIMQAGLKIFGEFDEGLAWAIVAEHPLNQSNRPLHHRRTFRDAHPLDDVPARAFDNANGFRVLLSSLGLKGAGRAPNAVLPPYKTFDVTQADADGVVLYDYGQYRIALQSAPPVQSLANPAEIAPPRAPETGELTIATFNVENLYDYQDDPSDPADFQNDRGTASVRPPFNYLPPDAASYRRKLEGIARQINQTLHAPTLVMLQEIEDQDLGGGSAQNSSTAQQPDQKLDVLQDLVTEIQRIGGPIYAIAADRDGADERGIICGLLYQSAALSLIEPGEDHFLLGTSPTFEAGARPSDINKQAENPKAFNALFTDVENGRRVPRPVFSRPVQVAAFNVTTPDGGKTLYVLNNHFSSRPNERVVRRRAQASFNAAIARSILEEDEDAFIVIGGDLNVFPRPDDPFPARPSDQLAPLYRQLSNVYAALLTLNPESAYTYVYEGQAQTLDQLFVSPVLKPKLQHVAVAHVNADYPDGETTNQTGYSDHDPLITYFKF